MTRRIGRGALAGVVLAASLAIAGSVGIHTAEAAAPYPPVPAEDPNCVLYYASIGSNCTLGKPTVVKVQPGEKFTISRSVGDAMYGKAVSCGDLACVYKSAYFLLHGPGVSIDGTCTNYGGLESAGTYTRPLLGTPGHCELRYDPSPYDLQSPGGWARVNFFTGQGSFPGTGETFLIGVRPELFKVDVTAIDTFHGRVPSAVYLVASGRNPDPASCPTSVADTWLPEREKPSCMKLTSWGSSYPYSAFVPNGTWDLIALEGSGSSTGKIRDRATGWRAKRITVADADQEATIRRMGTPELDVTAVVSTGKKVGLNQDAVVTIDVRAVGSNDTMPLENVTVFASQRLVPDGGALTVTAPAPANPGPVTLRAGQGALFRSTIRGAQVGPVELVLTASGSTKFYDRRTKELPLDITVTPEPPPPPPPPPPDAEVCGRDMLTKVSVASTGPLLQLLSTKGLGPGDSVIVRPCTPQAEQVTTTGVLGKTLSVDPLLTLVHPAGSPVVRAPADATILNKAVPAGTTTLPVAGTDFLRKGDEVVIEPGTGRAETGKVAGFGSILLRSPTKERHPAGAVVRKV